MRAVSTVTGERPTYRRSMPRPLDDDTLKDLAHDHVGYEFEVLVLQLIALRSDSIDIVKDRLGMQAAVGVQNALIEAPLLHLRNLLGWAVDVVRPQHAQPAQRVPRSPLEATPSRRAGLGSPLDGEDDRRGLR
jgi:hypothetical protein